VIVIEGDEQLRAAGIEVVAPSTSIDATRRLYWHDWSPGETYEIVANGVATPLIAPQVPTPYAVRRVLLEDVAEAAISGVTPDSVVRFAPDSRRLAIGTFHGALLVIDAYSGATLFEHRVSEGMVKSLAWSPDGRWLYAGEQSPDAFLLGIDTGEQSSSHVVKTADEDLTSSSRPSRYSIAWRQRLAERVETSRPAAGDRYAIYTLPAVHDLRVADDGRVFAASTHNWSRDGELTNRSVITCYSADGNQLWSLPPQDAWGLTIAHIDCDRAGKRLVCLPNRTQSTAAPAQPLFTNNIEPGTFYLIDARQSATMAPGPRRGWSMAAWCSARPPVIGWDCCARSSWGHRESWAICPSPRLAATRGSADLGSSCKRRTRTFRSAIRKLPTRRPVRIRAPIG
jgi:hypothetical protein